MRQEYPLLISFTFQQAMQLTIIITAKVQLTSLELLSLFNIYFENGLTELLNNVQITLM